MGKATHNAVHASAQTRVSGSTASRCPHVAHEIAALVRVYDRDDTTIVSTLDDTITMTPVVIEPYNSGKWWPEHLGDSPDLLGNAGTLRYAYFAEQNRLVIQQNLRNRLFNTTGYSISSVSAGRTAGFFNLQFTSNNRDFPITELKEVSK